MVGYEEKPKPWYEVGNSQIGVLDIGIMSKCEKVSTIVTVKDALSAVTKGIPAGVHEKYATGLEGYDRWIVALQSGNGDGFGVAYNAVVWNECREMAVGFLKEMESRLNIDSG